MTPEANELKQCTKCRVSRPLSQFSRHRSTSDYRRSSCKPCNVKRAQDFRGRNPDWARNYMLQRNFKMSIERYRELISLQGGGCAVCGTPFEGGKVGGRYACVDHDHSCCPGVFTCGNCVRGIVCFNCNVMMGKAKDDISILESAIRYLRGGSV